MPAAPVSAYQPAEVWSFNSVQLNQPYWNTTTFGGARYNLPTLRGQNYEVPFRAGQLNRSKWPDQRTLTLTMWVDGSQSSNGLIVGDPRLNFNNLWQQLRQALWTRQGSGGSVQGQLQRKWYITQNGTNGLVTATAMAEIAGSMDPVMNSRVNAVASIDFLLADPYFYGSQRTQAITGTGTITAFGEGVVGEGFPQAVSGFTVQVSTNCTVTNSTAGVSVTFNSALATATAPVFPVTLDVLRDTAVDANGVNQIACVTHSGSRMWMCLVNGGNAIAVTAGTATFTWNDCYV